jgi:alkylation response protein AidB-like acyl-CoA dehydrogenase
MDFDPSEEQQLIVETVRKFAQSEVRPRARDCDEAAKLPGELLHEAHALGLSASAIEEQYGGGGMRSAVTGALVAEELAWGDLAIALAILSPSLEALPISDFGSEAQKQRWLPRIADGSCLTSACLTEPGGGTDLGNMRTAATRADGGWRLTGTKVFISHAAHAGLFFVVATVDREKQHGGVTAFLVDPKTPGIAIGDFPMRTLKRDNLAEVHFEDAFVPDDALLGAPGKGFPVLGSALDMGRFSVAARCVGQAQRCLDLALPYAVQREAFGQRIGEFQLIQQKIAAMTCRTQAARGVVYQLGRMKDAGVPRASMESSMAKLLASQAAVANALDAIQIHGGYGLSEEYEIGRLLLEAKSLEFGEGTSELHTKMIAEFMLGIRKQ